MREQWRVTVNLILDREKNQADPPGEWSWRHLLDLDEDEEVTVSAQLVGLQNGH